MSNFNYGHPRMVPGREEGRAMMSIDLNATMGSVPTPQPYAKAEPAPEPRCICGRSRDQHPDGMGPGGGDCRSFRIASHAPA